MKHKMRVMGRQGHATMEWAPPGTEEHDPEEMSTTEAEFNKLIAANYVAFDVGPDQKDSRKLSKFDPEAQNITVVAPMAGGC